MSYLVVLSTASSKAEARKLAASILKKRLAACINIVPSVESHYWWKGKKVKGKEVLLLIKTRSKVFLKLMTVLKHEHSYSVPEILALPVVKGNPLYLSWVHAEVEA